MFRLFFFISEDSNGTAYPKAHVHDSLVTSPISSVPASVILPGRVLVADAPHKPEIHIASQQNKMTAISTAFKATESAAPTIVTSPQLSTTVVPSAAVVVGVSPDHNKYLHKKFKRIASTTLDTHVQSTNSAPSRHQPIEQNHVDQTQRVAQTNGQHIEGGTRLNEEPPVELYNNHSTHFIKQENASNSTVAQSTNTLIANFNETTEASVTAKTNTPQTSPMLQKNNHLNNNNNYTIQHNNNNIGPPQNQQPQYLPNIAPATSLIYVPTMVSNKPNADPQEQSRPLYYINSSSPSLLEAQSFVLRSTPEHAVFVDTQKHSHQHHQLPQQHFQPQQLQFQPLVAERTTSPSIAVQQQQSQPQATQQPSSSDSPTPGRYVCPFCQLNCAKPSVLQKHIRAHTNERPYPCVPCGFAFKTRSNLYKHRR